MKKISYLFLAVFLYAQTASLWHMAEHAFCKHKHNGKECEISLFFEQVKTPDLPTGATVPFTVAFVIIALEVCLLFNRQEYKMRANEPRAPPALTL